MEKMNSEEAFANFWIWIKQSGVYKSLSRPEKQQLQNTRQAVIKNEANSLRLRRAFEKYRPGVYELREAWVIKTKNPASD